MADEIFNRNIYIANNCSAPYEALVVKASGLAAGKGVVVANTREEACAAVDEILGSKKYGSAGNTIVVEEKLSGEEISVCCHIDIEYFSYGINELPRILSNHCHRTIFPIVSRALFIARIA